ncbi:aminoglycoside 3'-phosphotransferase/choline kinase family protein [Georgenia sp. MJ206]|uniref:aminoglycoside phosphotransferase family protein n=1 Tax=Georgenia wangjunii TaxID=3117730 RepID=UPI002F26055A
MDAPSGGDRGWEGVPDAAVEVAPGAQPIGQGRTALVYELGDGTVLRRYRNAGADARLEAAVMEHVRRHGIPVPRVHRASGRDIVMERVDGPTMLADILERPVRIREHAGVMAQLHRRLDGVPPHPGLPVVPGEPARLLHCDLHPGNIILTPSGPVLIDWSEARSGPAAVDVAATWLVVACLEHPDPTVDALLVPVRAALLEAFLGAVDDRDAAARILPDVARARMADPVTTPQERERLAVLAAGTTDVGNVAGGAPGGGPRFEA